MNERDINSWMMMSSALTGISSTSFLPKKHKTINFIKCDSTKTITSKDDNTPNKKHNKKKRGY
tara:strand:- start:5840 stop:6028 length:189 start_codon:yes stop_codon:yes gene_type:complete